MAWVKIDDQFTDHPKAADAGPLGIAMQVAGLCYSNRHLTDGFISQKVAARLLDFTGIAIELPCRADPDDPHVSAMRVQWLTICDDLTRAGLWEEVEGGWQIHDYLEYNPSRAETLTKRAADLERKRTPKGNESHSAQIPRGIPMDSKRPVPGPVPVPDPLPKKDVETPPLPPTPIRPPAQPVAPPDGGERVRESSPLPAAHAVRFDAFWTAYPKKVGKKTCEAWWGKRRPDADLTQAILDSIEAHKHGDQWQRNFIKEPINWLKEERWNDEVAPPPPRAPDTTPFIGKDKDRADVLQRALEKRGYEFAGTGAIAHPHGGALPHDPLRIGDGRVPR